MKLSEMREKTVEELQSAIADWKKDLFTYKMQLSTHKLENTALISKTKTLIAQAKTVIKNHLQRMKTKRRRYKMPKKERQGTVISNKMDKTIVVKVANYEPHPKYKKIMETNKNYKVHDENNVGNIGDTVKIVESKPISGTKRWTLAEVVEKAK